MALLPWAFKLVYGIISDNYPIFGSKRKLYMVILSMIAGLTMLQISFYKGDNYRYVTAMLCLQNFALAFANVIIDALLVVQARKFPKEGAADL